MWILGWVCSGVRGVAALGICLVALFLLALAAVVRRDVARDAVVSLVEGMRV